MARTPAVAAALTEVEATMRLMWLTACALILGTTFASAQQEPAPDGLKVQFGSGKSGIAADQAAVLDQAARLFREGSPIVMIVSGSADTVGPADRNLVLSIRRAQAVAEALADRGIPIERLQVLGRGNSELAVATSIGVPNAENRTVTITWR